MSLRNLLPTRLPIALLAVLGAFLAGVGPAAAATSSQFHGHVYLGSTSISAGLNDVLVTAHGAYGTYSGATDATGNWRVTIPDAIAGYTISYHFQGGGAIAYADMWDANEVNGSPAYSRNSNIGGNFADDTVYDVVLPAPGTISGTVTLQRGTVGAGDVSVRFSRANDAGVWSAETQVAVTDAAGHYSVPNFAPGYYRVHFVWLRSTPVQSRYWSGGSGASGDMFDTYAPGLQVLAGQQIDVLLFPKQNASGHVNLGSPGDRLRVSYAYDANEGQIESGRPRTSPQWTPVTGVTATVDPITKAFSLPNLADAFSYRFTVDDLDAPGLTETVYRYTYGITLTGPSGLEDVSVELASTGVVSGSLNVQGAPNGSTLHVGAVDSTGHLSAQTVTTGSTYYTLPALPVGTYTLIYRFAPLTDAHTFDASQKIAVPGEPLEAPGLTVVYYTSTQQRFTGHVAASNGTPLAGIAMTAFEYDAYSGDYATSYSTTTDAQGAYTFANLPVDVYEIQARDPAQTYATMEYDNESPYYEPDYLESIQGLIDGLDFTMPLAAHITGTVHGPTPAEFAAGNVSAEVQVQDYSSGSPIWTGTGDVWPVNAGGTYDIGDLPPDDYRLTFSSDGTPIYPPVTTPTETVAEGQTRSNVDVTLVKALPGSFGSLAPSRLLDTRIGVGASGAIAAHGTLSLQVTGRGGVPASGVSSVVLNVTLASATAAGSVTAYASGKTLPLASNLNFVAGQIVPNLVVVPVGADGKVNLYNGSSQPIQLVADVSGYYVSGDGSSTSGSFGSLPPARLLDTRIAVGASGPVAAHGSVILQVTGKGGVPATGVSSVVLNVTETGATAAGSVTVYPSGQTLPVTSNLNFVAGKDVPNLVVVPVGDDGKVILYNGSSQAIQLVADVSGYYTSGTPSTPGSFKALAPSRLLDSRIGVGATGAVPSHGVLSLQVTGRGGVPATGVTSVVLNVTETGATAAGFVTAYPTGTALPIASNLNFVAGQDVPNLVVVPVGPDGKVNLYNGSSQPIHLVADVAGYFLVGAP